MYPKKFASGEDLAGKPVTLSVSTVRREQLHPQPGSPAVDKLVVYFAHATKGVILSAPLARQIAAVLGDDTDQWASKKITLYPEPMQVAGKSRIAIRARAPDNGESTPPASLQEPDEEEA
jgi:hypothetical protein